VTVDNLEQDLENGGSGFTELGLNSQSAQLRYQKNKAFSIAWLHPEVRQRFRGADSLSKLLNQLKVSDIDVLEVDALDYFSNLSFTALRLDSETQFQLIQYARNHNIVNLRNAMSEEVLSLRALIDKTTNQLFLEASKDGAVVSVININPLRFDVVRLSGEASDGVKDFINKKLVWLELER